MILYSDRIIIIIDARSTSGMIILFIYKTIITHFSNSY